MLKIFVAFGILVLLLKPSQPLHAASQSFSVMTYNVENLFDTEHDIGKDDYTFLPMNLKLSTGLIKKCKGQGWAHFRKQCETIDWTPDLLEKKLQRVAEVISSYGQSGADIVVLPEVENIKVLKMLQEKLPKSGYQTAILLEDNDKRGIDIAVLSRFKTFKAAKIQNIDFASWFEKPKPFKKKKQQSRGFLQVYLEGPSNTKITLIGAHLPSQMSPVEERQRALETLNALGEAAAREFPIVLAAGDFNIDAGEDGALYRGVLAPVWSLSHLVGCHTCMGSYYYAKHKAWSFLDAILLWKQQNSTWSMVPDSVDVIKKIPGQVDGQGQPQRFNYETGEGFTDHLPVVLELSSTGP